MSDAQAKLYVFLLLTAAPVGPSAGEVETSRREIAESLSWSLGKAQRTLLSLAPQYLEIDPGANVRKPSKIRILRFLDGSQEPFSVPPMERKVEHKVEHKPAKVEHKVEHKVAQSGTQIPPTDRIERGYRSARSGEYRESGEVGGGRAHARDSQPPAAASQTLLEAMLSLQGVYGPCDRSPDWLAKRLLSRPDVGGDEERALGLLAAMRDGLPEPSARKPFQFFLSDYLPGGARPAKAQADDRAGALMRRLSR